MGGGSQVRDRNCVTFPRFLTEKEPCIGNASDSRNCNDVSCSACVYDAIRSPGNQINSKNNYHKNVKSLSECQTLCKIHNTSCEYFTYYEKQCMLKTGDAKWNLIHRKDSVTASRDCDLTQKDAYTQTTKSLVVETITESTSNDGSDNNEDNKIGGLAGAGAMLTVIFVAIGIFLWYKKKRVQDPKMQTIKSTNFDNVDENYDDVYAEDQPHTNSLPKNKPSKLEITENPYYGVEEEN